MNNKIIKIKLKNNKMKMKLLILNNNLIINLILKKIFLENKPSIYSPLNSERD